MTPVAGQPSGTPPVRSASPATLLSRSGRIRAVAPAPGQRYWRLSVHDSRGHRIGQTTGGPSRATAERKLLELERRLAAHAPAGADATRGSELLDYFVDPTRPKNQRRPHGSPQWSASYTDQTRQILDRYLRPRLDAVPLQAWSAEQAYAVLDACPTNYMVNKVRRTLSAVLGVGVANGFLRSDQRDLHLVTVPLRPELRPPRRIRTRSADGTRFLQPDEVPSTEQVRRLAAARPPGMAPAQWEGTVNLLAYGGLRIGEWLASGSDDVLGDYPAGLIAVRWQLIEPHGAPKRLAPPKNGFGRLVAVCETTPLGFPLRGWLIDRAHQAAREHAEGRNPGSTLVVGPHGGWWTRSNFRARCFNPAATAAGWERLGWRGPVRRRVDGRWVTTTVDRWDWRHTLHALRHHYACTARDLWGWTGAELCLNGGWADTAFVLGRYYGSTSETYAQAVAKQARLHSAGRAS